MASTRFRYNRCPHRIRCRRWRRELSFRRKRSVSACQSRSCGRCPQRLRRSGRCRDACRHRSAGYARQRLLRCPRPLRKRMSTRLVRRLPIILRVPAMACRFSTRRSPRRSSHTVSYTHLDVYKRQDRILIPAMPRQTRSQNHTMTEFAGQAKERLGN